MLGVMMPQPATGCLLNGILLFNIINSRFRAAIARVSLSAAPD